jgi:hypothetical protein
LHGTGFTSVVCFSSVSSMRVLAVGPMELPLLSDYHSVSIHIYPCCDPPISVSVLCILVCAGRFAPMASGCITILSFLTNCTYDRDFLTVKTRTFNMLMFIKILTINISCKLCKFG